MGEERSSCLELGTGSAVDLLCWTRPAAAANSAPVVDVVLPQAALLAPAVYAYMSDAVAPYCSFGYAASSLQRSRARLITTWSLRSHFVLGGLNLRLLIPVYAASLLAQEFAAGHVKGALNLDSSAFSDTALVDKLVEQLIPKSQVVVHCAKR